MAKDDAEEIFCIRCFCGESIFRPRDPKKNTFTDENGETMIVSFCRNHHAINVKTFDAPINPESGQPDLQVVFTCDNCHYLLPPDNDERWKWKDDERHNGEIVCPRCNILVSVRDLIAISVPISYEGSRSSTVSGGQY